MLLSKLAFMRFEVFTIAAIAGDIGECLTFVTNHLLGYLCFEGKFNQCFGELL
jgi:hypothetical protein